MQFLDTKQLNARAADIFHKDLPKNSTFLEGEGTEVKNIDIDDELIKLRRHASSIFKLDRDTLTISAIEKVVDMLAGQLAYDVGLYKSIKEKKDKVSLKLSYTSPRIVIAAGKKEKDLEMHIEILVALENDEKR